MLFYFLKCTLVCLVGNYSDIEVALGAPVALKETRCFDSLGLNPVYFWIYCVTEAK